MRRALLLVEEKASDAIRVSLEGEGPIFQVWQEDWRNFDIIINDLALGEAGLGIKTLLRLDTSTVVPSIWSCDLSGILLGFFANYFSGVFVFTQAQKDRLA